MAKIARERIERAARIYASNQDAAAALGIQPGSFSRLCRQYGIPTPRQRRAERRKPQPVVKIDLTPEQQDSQYCECGSPKPKGKLYCLTCDTLLQDVGAAPITFDEDGTIRDGHARAQIFSELNAGGGPPAGVDCYVGIKGDDGICRIYRHDGTELTPERSLALRNHSPTGFAWGYGGSGPAQAALAILLDFTDHEGDAKKYYMVFKRDVVAALPDHWYVTTEQIAEWLSQGPSLNDGIYDRFHSPEFE